MGGNSTGQKIKEVSQGERKDLSSQKHSEIISVGTEGEQRGTHQARGWEYSTSSPPR